MRRIKSNFRRAVFPSLYAVIIVAAPIFKEYNEIPNPNDSLLENITAGEVPYLCALSEGLSLEGDIEGSKKVDEAIARFVPMACPERAREIYRRMGLNNSGLIEVSDIAKELYERAGLQTPQNVDVNKIRIGLERLNGLNKIYGNQYEKEALDGRLVSTISATLRELRREGFQEKAEELEKMATAYLKITTE